MKTTEKFSLACLITFVVIVAMMWISNGTTHRSHDSAATKDATRYAQIVTISRNSPDVSLQIAEGIKKLRIVDISSPKSRLVGDGLVSAARTRGYNAYMASHYSPTLRVGAVLVIRASDTCYGPNAEASTVTFVQPLDEGDGR